MQKEAIQRLEKQLHGWEDRIHELEVELDRIGPKTRSRYFRDVQDLKERRDAAKSRLRQLRLQQAASWEEEDLQAGIIRVFDDIGCRVNRLISQVTRTH